MKRVILCEGKTDAILISYFLERCFNWVYLPQSPIRLPVEDRQNEELNWYQHLDRKGNGEELAIWGVGGLSQIPQKLKKIIDNNQSNPRSEDRFEYIVLFFDRDEPTRDCLAVVEAWLVDAEIKLESELRLGSWLNAEVDLVGVTPPDKHQLKLLCIVLPPEGEGALEAFLIDNWQRFSDADLQLTRAARAFILDLPELPRQAYLGHRRLPDKACLGTILAVFSPDGVFQKIDPKLKSVPWEEIQDVLDVYEKLEVL